MKCNVSAFALAIAVGFGPPLCSGQTIVRVEEDWELSVVQPDEQIDAPQITMSMLPFGQGSDILFQFDLNHATTPVFSAGGLQLRICDDDQCYATARMLAGITLRQPAELVSWTQVVQRSDDGYFFGIINGSSTSFGSMGDGTDVVYIANSAAGGATLDTYDVRHSLENSEVTFASNRISWLRLKQIRLYYSNGHWVQLPLNASLDL